MTNPKGGDAGYEEGAASPTGRNTGDLPDEARAPTPDRVVADAKSAFTAPKKELLTLDFDSLIDGNGQPEAHILRFVHPALVVELAVAARLEGTEIRGVVDGQAERAALHLRNAELAIVSEIVDGSFDFRPVPHGLVRLSIERAAPDPEVWTEWFRV